MPTKATGTHRIQTLTAPLAAIGIALIPVLASGHFIGSAQAVHRKCIVNHIG